MNYYKHHIGDYAAATAHLSWLEDSAYTRLLRRYYATEAALPADVAQCQRLVGARSREERAAVETVLREFFSLEADGWHNKRADEEIADAQSKAERNREVGKRGGRPPKQKPTGNPDGFQQETQTVSTNKPTENPNVTLANSHKPIAISQEPASKVIPIPGQGPPHALLARALVAAGIAVNPSSPRLIALAEAGCPVATVEAAIAEARRAKGDGERIAAGYVIAIAERWMAEPAKGPPERAAASPLAQRAAVAWETIIETVSRAGRNYPPRLDDPAAVLAMRSLGGFTAICDGNERDLPRLARDFAAAYRDACSAGAEQPGDRMAAAQ